MKSLKTLKYGHNVSPIKETTKIGQGEDIDTGFYYCVNSKEIVYFIKKDNLPSFVNPIRVGCYYSREHKNEENDLCRGNHYNLHHLDYKFIDENKDEFISDIFYLQQYSDSIQLLMNFLVDKELYEIAACVVALTKDNQNSISLNI